MSVTTAHKALTLARKLQADGYLPFQARCRAAGAYGCAVGDINRAYAEERRNRHIPKPITTVARKKVVHVEPTYQLLLCGI